MTFDQQPEPKDSSSIEREKRIKQWVVESSTAFLLELDTNNKDAIMKIDEDRLNLEDQHTTLQNAFESKPKDGKVRGQRRKCRPRDKVRKCKDAEYDYPQHIPCNKITCEIDPGPQTSRCVGDSFRCLVPDAIDAISSYSPSIRQKISEQTWFTAVCTTSRK